MKDVLPNSHQRYGLLPSISIKTVNDGVRLCLRAADQFPFSLHFNGWTCFELIWIRLPLQPIRRAQGELRRRVRVQVRGYRQSPRDAVAGHIRRKASHERSRNVIRRNAPDECLFSAGARLGFAGRSARQTKRNRHAPDHTQKDHDTVLHMMRRDAVIES